MKFKRILSMCPVIVNAKTYQQGLDNASKVVDLYKEVLGAEKRAKEWEEIYAATNEALDGWKAIYLRERDRSEELSAKVKILEKLKDEAIETMLIIENTDSGLGTNMKTFSRGLRQMLEKFR